MPVCGSSPLARGLRLGRTSRPCTRRIIPARAGFTLAIGYTFRLVTDHPRSRGVYSLAVALTGRGTGSSPLARGLLVLEQVCRSGVRIIPARAGFTPGSVRRTTWGPDHPRSRGVYLAVHLHARVAGGSSPLARGLLPGFHPVRSDVRIIPARAGFTSSGARWRSRATDHPRSRGVYLFGSSLGLGFQGSSPLARGLRGRRRRSGSARGIIPARAGFTLLAAGAVVSVGDHPRSRGVYGAPVGAR